MKRPRITPWRLVLAAIACIVIAGVALPLLDAGGFRDSVRQSLREALGRDVELGDVHLDLFSGPGFSVKRVVIYDEPSAGIEPFAYVESLEARVSLASLWTRQLEFASLTLINPSLNLVRPEEGRWNFLPLLERTAGARLPNIQVRNGRINFKFGDTKSIFYLANASIEITPPSTRGGEWSFRFDGAPARTDRVAPAYGSLRARGRWRPGATGGGVVDVSLDLQRSSLGEAIRLLHGHDIGVHGQVSARARLTGPVSNIGITGRLEISDVHRWDLMPPYTGFWPFDFTGRLDLSAQTLDIDTSPGQQIGFAVRASEFLAKAQWTATVTLHSAPIAQAVSLARQMGLSVPEGLEAAGDLNGDVGYSPVAGIAGVLGAENVSVRAPGAPELRFEHGELVIGNDAVRLQPTSVAIAGSPLGRLEGEYSWRSGRFDAILTARSAPIEATAGAARMVGGAPLLEQCSKGTWRGMVRYQRRSGEDRGRWSGVLEVEDAEIALDGLAAPVTLSSARISLREPGLVVDRIRGEAGGIEFTGDYRLTPEASHPHRFRLRAGAVPASDLEALLAPTLRRRDEGFLRRALRLGRTRVPEWLAARRADVSFQIAALEGAGFPIRRMRGRMRWTGPNVEISGFAVQAGGSALAGDLSINLRGSVPAYHLEADFKNRNWAGGEWEGKAVLATSGTGATLVRNLKGKIDFSGRSVEISGERFSTISGHCALAMAESSPVFTLTGLSATAGDEVFQGQGGTDASGVVQVELSAASRGLRLTGTLWPLKLDANP
ncbi:MAG: AsmA family protein [bacterium]